MTWDQLELFVNAATQRDKTEMVLHARLIALGTACGFSGDMKPLKNLARAAQGDDVRLASSASPQEFLRGINEMLQPKNGENLSHGTGRRRARRKAARGRPPA